MLSPSEQKVNARSGRIRDYCLTGLGINAALSTVAFRVECSSELREYQQWVGFIID